MYKLLKALAIIALTFSLVGTNLYADVITEDELKRMHEIGIDHKSTAPPTGELRACAEWESSQGVIIRYPLGIPYSLVAEMSEDVIVYTICTSGYYSQAVSNYTNYGVNLDNCEFIIASTNTYWTRDYGPWFIFTDEVMGIVDPVYNRPRPQDDVIPQAIGSEWSMSVYGMSLSTPGGNHMTDGLGMSMSTELVYNENPSLTEAEVDSIMLAYLGNDYTVLDYVENYGIHHIDCWAKMLNPNTILVKDVASGSSMYTKLNQRAEFLSQQIGPWGVPYTVIRIYCPSGAAYTNSLILNKKVFVPIIGSAWDDDAIQTYQDAMPGYEVIGFTGSWLDNDAIHCRAMGVPDREMLWVKHVPLQNTNDTINDRLVNVEIQDCSGAGLISDSLKIYYSVDGGPYTFAILNATVDPDSFYGYIPVQDPGAEVAYFIKAADLSDRVETHPYIGEPWAHRFEFTYENNPPTIAPVSPKEVDEGEYLSFPVFASDPDGTTPELMAEDLPDNATFTDNEDGSGLFEFNPSFFQAGVYTPMFIASDGLDEDTTIATITVININRPPVLTEIEPQEVDEAQLLTFMVYAEDPDSTFPDLRAFNTPLNSDFDDYGDGTGQFSFEPDYSQQGPYTVRFIADDSEYEDTIFVDITVHDINIPPEIIISDDTILCATYQDFGFYPTWEDIDDPTVAISYELYPGWLSVSNDSLVGSAPEDTSLFTFRVIVADEAVADSADVTVHVWKCGDVDGSGEVDIDDVVMLISYIFVPDSPAPDPYESGDVNCVGGIDIDDVVYLIAYIFTGGDVPCASCP